MKFEVIITDAECERSDIPFYHSFEFKSYEEATFYILTTLCNTTDELVARIRAIKEE